MTQTATREAAAAAGGPSRRVCRPVASGRPVGRADVGRAVVARRHADVSRRRRPRGEDPLGRGPARGQLGRSGEPARARHGPAGRPAGLGHGRPHRRHTGRDDQRGHVDPGQRLLRRQPEVLRLRRHRGPGPGARVGLPPDPRRPRRASRRPAPPRQGHVGDAGRAERRAGLLRPHAERLLDRPRRREPGPLRRDPGRLRPRGVQERRRRGHGEEAPQGGGDRARRATRSGPRTRAGSSRRRTTSPTTSGRTPRPRPCTSTAPCRAS